MFLKSEFSNRLVQVSLFSAIVYYITAYPVVFEKARKYFPVKFKKTHHLLLFHTFVFAVLMYVLTYFVFDPIVKVVEGIDPVPQPGPATPVRPCADEDDPTSECTFVCDPGHLVNNGKTATCIWSPPGEDGHDATSFTRPCQDEQNTKGEFYRIDEKTLGCRMGG